MSLLSILNRNVPKSKLWDFQMAAIIDFKCITFLQFLITYVVIEILKIKICKNCINFIIC